MEQLPSKVSTNLTTAIKLSVAAIVENLTSDASQKPVVPQVEIGNELHDRRYSGGGECVGTQTAVLIGDPDPAHISTSFVERQNLTMRMSMRRFTRLTNGFSKKIENHEAAIALHFMHYNFCRVHKTLRVTPAMEAGLSGHVWTVEELVALIPEPVAKKRGSYKKRS
jgi:hypothetical protein